MRKVLVAVLAGTLCVVAIPAAAAPPVTPASPAAPSPTPDPLAAQLTAQLQRQAALDLTVQTLASQLVAARDTQRSLSDLVVANQRSISQTLARLAVEDQRYSDASSRQAAAHATAVAARTQESRDKHLLALYVRNGYETSDGILSLVFSSTSINELMARAADVSRLSRRTASMVEQIASDLAIALNAEAVATSEASAAQLAAAHLQAQEQTLRQETDHANALIGQLDSQAAATAAEIRAANTQSLAVAQAVADTRMAELDSTIASAEQAAWQTAEYYLQQHLGTLPSSIAVPPATPVNPDGSQLVWPVSGTSVGQRFGPSIYPFEPAFGGYAHFHTGLDLSGSMGTPVMAAAAGVIVETASSTVGYGLHVIMVSAGGLYTLYGHLSAMLVHPGDSVRAGQVIGMMGSTGNSTGPHLHFEVRVNGLPLDPIRFLPPLTGAPGT